ncbi:hypothetical protein HWI79_210 [Cryptosporidium felis]|nr:hypothetical protein HWI79_210 [Cryptosporidium felis]
MTKIPDILENYMICGKKSENISEVYTGLIHWLDSNIENYELTISKFTVLCNFFLRHIDLDEQISPHLNFILTDIISIIYERSSKCLIFPSNCNCTVDNPFDEFTECNLEFKFWQSLRELSIKVATKCSSKEGYVIFVEIILGAVSLPIFSDNSRFKLESEDAKANENIRPLALSEKKVELPRYYRYLGLHCSLISISRMKRNKAQFITTVCSLALRKFVYDTKCDSLHVSSCIKSDSSAHKCCTIVEIQFLQYLVNVIIKLLFDCLTESKCDAEYKTQEINVFNSGSYENNINVTQHTIYSFLMKILEKIIIMDFHDIEKADNSVNSIGEQSSNQIRAFNAKLLHSNPFNSIINVLSPNENCYSMHSNSMSAIWPEIIYKICYYISYVAPHIMIDTLNNIPICIFDVESQSGDLDVTPLTLACYSYALFMILESKFPTEVNFIYPKHIISLQLKLNIIYRTISVFLTYSDCNKYGYEFSLKNGKKKDISLSYFNTFLQKNTSCYEVINGYYSLINNRLQDKAYYLFESNIHNLIECKKTVPDLFNTLFGLNWHQNIVVKQIIFSFTRIRADIDLKITSKQNFVFCKPNIYSHIFDKLTSLLLECYSYSILFDLYFNLMEFQRELFSVMNQYSNKVTIALLCKLRDFLWKEICVQEVNQIKTLINDLNRIIKFSSTYIIQFKDVDIELSQIEVATLIVLNLLKVISLSYKNNVNYLRSFVDFLLSEPKVLENYLKLIQNFFKERNDANFNQKEIINFVIDDISEILNLEWK